MATKTLSRIRIVLWTVVAIVVLGLIALSIWPQDGGQAVAQEQYGAGDYALVNDAGEPVDDSVFVGQPSVVFFGFTHCPDVCPTTLGEMAGWFSQLGDEAQDLRGYFVTVDPARDTPEVMRQYVDWASEDITGITGDPEEIASMTDAWGVYSEQVPLEDGGYTMDHTATVFLLNARGEFEGTIAYGENTQTAVDKLRRLVAQS